MTDTLVLSAGYEPMGRTSWKRAIQLWLRGVAEVYREYPDKWVTVDIKMPSVIRLLHFCMGNTRKHPMITRENLYLRDHGQCQYCGVRVTRSEMTFEHIVPKSQGGRTTWLNVVIGCMECNQRKRNRTPAQAGMKLRCVPVAPKSLPVSMRLVFRHEKGMPIQWAEVLKDLGYWHSELKDED